MRDIVARAIWKVKPDCFGKAFPPDGWDDRARRAYPHNPIASLDLCYAYADAAIAAMNSAPEMMDSLSVEKAETGAETINRGETA